MGKVKQREKSEVEHLRGQIRKLESENRQLRKRIRVLDKKAHFYEDITADVAEDIIIKNNCPSCSKGNLIILDLKHVVFEQCDSCEYRKKL